MHRQSGVPLPLLLSVVGDDIAGDALLQHWQSAVRAPHRGITRVAGASTPVVSILLDSAGEVPSFTTARFTGSCNSFPAIIVPSGFSAFRAVTIS